MKKRSIQAEEKSHGVLLLDMSRIEIRAFPISIQKAKALKKKMQSDDLDYDDLYSLTMGSESFLWFGNEGTVAVRWRDTRFELDPPLEKARYKALDFRPQGTELLLISRESVTWRTKLLSPYAKSNLRVKYKFHRLEKIESWAEPTVFYGEEEFDEYIWEDGSRPEYCGGNCHDNYWLFSTQAGHLSVTRLV